MITADTITDEQIEELAAYYKANEDTLGWVGRNLSVAFYDALNARGKVRKHARAMCAEILNARAEGSR